MTTLQQGTTVTLGACPHDCPDTCAMLVTVEDGRATKVRGDPDHPFTRGGLCVKVNNYLDHVYSPGPAAAPAAAQRAEGQRPVRARSPGTTRSTRSPTGSGRSSPSTAPRRSCRSATSAPRASSTGSTSATRSSTSSARRSPSARTATPASCTAYIMTIGATAGVDPESLVHSRYIVDLGVQHDLDTTCTCGRSSPRRSSAARRSWCIDPVAPPHRAEGRLAHPDPARHRRRARAGDDARDHRRGAARRGLRRASTPSASTSSPSASRSTRRSGRPRRPGSRPTTSARSPASTPPPSRR